MHSLIPDSDPAAPDHHNAPEREPLEEGIPRRGTFKREVWNVVSTYGQEGGGIRTYEIAEKLGKPAANVRATLAQLEANGLVVRIAMGTWQLP